MLQPDQDATRWDAHSAAYERMFEPLTDGFAHTALDRLGNLDQADFIDVAAGTGGAALAAAARGARVTAIDASTAMIARIAARASGIEARVADAAALPYPDGAFGAALSSFGIVLLPNPARGMAELHRVLRPGARVAIVTWTEPHRYELASRLRDAVIAVRGAPPAMAELPAQLRFTDPARLAALLTDAGFASIAVERAEASLQAASAASLAGSLDFAPGMTAMLDSLGPDRPAILQSFADTLTADQGTGAVTLGAVAHIAIGQRP